MSFTVNTIIANARRKYPDMSTTIAETLGAQIHRELYSFLPMFRTSADLNVVAGTRQYVISADFMEIERVEYHTALNVFTVLEPTDYDFLNDVARDYKSTANGTPTRFFTTSGDSTNGPMIGVDPAPDTTTSAGYPILKVFGTQATAFAIGGTIYVDIPNTRVYELGIQHLYAVDEDPQSAAGLYELFLAELDTAKLHNEKKNSHLAGSLNK